MGIWVMFNIVLSMSLHYINKQLAIVIEEFELVWRVMHRDYLSFRCMAIEVLLLSVTSLRR